MRFLIIVLIISMMLIPAQNAFALPAKMDCTSILDEWSKGNYPSGNFVHDVIPPVTIDGKNTSFFIKAEQSTKNDDHIQLEMKLLDRNDHIMENSKFFVELLQDDKIIHRDLFYTSSGTLVLDFDQNNSTKETTIDAEQANMGYFFSSSDHITVNSPILDGTYQLKVTAMGACDKMVFFFPQKAVPVFHGSFLVSDGHVSGIAVLKGSNPEKIASPLKQFKSGVPVQNVQCDEGLQLMMKSNNGNPVCIKPSTASKLLQMGIVDRIPVGSMQKPQPITAVHKPQYGSCSVSFIEYGLSKSYPNAMNESKAPINAMGMLFSSFDEAKNDAGIQDIFLPTYMPDCLKLHSIRVNKAVPTASTTTIVYLLDGMEPKGYFTENNVTENGLLILIQKERGIVYSLPINYVQDQARENKDLGWNYTIISNSAVLLKNRDVNMPTEADMVFMHQGIRVSSKILEIAEIEKITRSMFE